MDDDEAGCARATRHAITATRVEDAAQRLRCLPDLFGARCVVVESAIFNTLRMLCSRYDGGFWNFYRLSNGGFYMAPDIASPLVLLCPNHYEVTLSADSAGIVACTYAYSHLSFLPGGEACAHAYRKLSAYVADHADYPAIRAATD